MEKEILFSLKGLQMSQEDQEELETIMAAEYYLRNDHHYIVYDEVMEGFEEVTRNIFKFDGSCLEVTKRGAVNVHMLFEEQKKNMTTYHTPFGDILIGIDTEKIEVSEEENKIHVHVDYSLEANYQHLANCKIDMKIYPKKEGAKLFT